MKVFCFLLAAISLSVGEVLMICQEPYVEHVWDWNEEEHIMGQILTPSTPLGRIETVWIYCGFMEYDDMDLPPYVPFNLKIYKNDNGLPGECLYTHFFTFPPVEDWYGFNTNYQWKPEYGESFIVAMESLCIEYGEFGWTRSEIFYDYAPVRPNRNLDKFMGWPWQQFWVGDWGFWVVYVPNVLVEPSSVGNIKANYR